MRGELDTAGRANGAAAVRCPASCPDDDAERQNVDPSSGRLRVDEANDDVAEEPVAGDGGYRWGD